MCVGIQSARKVKGKVKGGGGGTVNLRYHTAMKKKMMVKKILL